MPTPSSCDSQSSEWEALVGKAILRFGDIELVSIRCLEAIPKDQISTSAAKLEFGRRAELLTELLEARTDRLEVENEILVALKRAMELAKTRNLIAHNPVMLDLYINAQDTESYAVHAITSARSEHNSIDLVELKEFTAEVESLASELWMSFLKLQDNEHVMFGIREKR